MKKTTALWYGTAAALCVLLIGCRSQNISDSAATRHAGNADSSPADASSQAANSDTQEAASAENSTEATESSSQEAASVSERVQQMTLEEKVCQKFIVTPESLTGFNGTVVAAGDMTRTALETYPVGGLIYFSANLETQEQTREMLTNTQNYAQELSGIGVFLAVDEEGGTVARAADSLGTTAFSDMSVYGADADTEKANEIGSTIGNDLKALGFNLDFAPVADVNLNSKNELGNRIFSSDPAVVASMSAGVVTGLQNSGVCATLKHFPGLGAGDGNTHRGSVYIERTLEELEQAEFPAFQGGIAAGADFVMVGHQITSGSGDNLPGDLSSVVITQWLKNELGFQGIVITDAQNMGAITANYSPGEAAVQSFSAGVDIVLMPDDLPEAVDAVVKAVENGTLEESSIDESVTKILTKKEKSGLLS